MNQAPTHLPAVACEAAPAGTVDLALGTVQFGVKYGVAGRGEAVPEDEARAILEAAEGAGIRTLDTAPAYGDIEARLDGLIGDLDFAVVSKVGALPTTVDADGAARFVEESIARSALRLGCRLTTLLFHHAEDLLSVRGDAAWRAAEMASGGRMRLGVSCYDPATLIELRRRYPITVAQLPGNAFDQRLTGPGVAVALAGIEVHVRSVFLQGLLLMPRDAAIRHVPAAAEPLAAWTDWCAHEGLRPSSAALAVARGLPGVRVCVVGVDRLVQLQEILGAWREGAPGSAPSLACDDLDVIEPRRWTAS
jgi:hypothetical protein